MLGVICIATSETGRMEPSALLDDLLGAPLLARSIAGTLPSNEAVTAVVVVPEALTERVQKEVVERFGLDEVDQVIGCDADAIDGLRLALEAIPDDVDVVLLQEGAQVLVPAGLVERVVEAARQADGAAPAISLPQVVVADEDGATPLEMRPRLRALQGPQAFQVRVLKDALSESVQSEAPVEIVAQAGKKVVLVEGDSDNFLLHQPSDIGRALEVYSRRAVDFAFVYPRDLLPDDPLADALAKDPPDQNVSDVTTEVSTENGSADAGASSSDDASDSAATAN